MKLVFMFAGSQPRIIPNNSSAPQLDFSLMTGARAKYLATLARPFGPFGATYSSLANCSGRVCELLKIDRVVSILALNAGSLMSDPEAPQKGALVWKRKATAVVTLIDNEVRGGHCWEEKVIACKLGAFLKPVLVFTHWPIVAGMVAKVREVKKAMDVEAILADRSLRARGILVFNTDPVSGEISMQ